MKKITYLLMVLCTFLVMGTLVSCGWSVYDCEHTQLIHHEAVPCSCGEDGSIEYWECAKCHRYFSDVNATNSIGVLDTVDHCEGHDLVHHEEVTYCLEEGTIEYWQCSKCDCYYSDADGKNEIEVEDLVHEAVGHDLVHTDAVAATCLDTGNIEYWYCKTCHKYYSDAACTTEVEDANDLITEPIGHNLVHHTATEPTCGDATHGQTGNTEYWYCDREDCHKYYSDAEATTETTLEDVTIAVTSNHEHCTFAETHTEPTVTTPGVNWYTCDECGATVEVPVYKYQFKDTTNNTGAWSFVTNEDTFVDDGNGTYTSNLSGTATIALYAIVFRENCKIEFKFDYQGTGSYDLFAVIYGEFVKEQQTVNVTTILAGPYYNSGTATYSGEFKAGEAVVFYYTNYSRITLSNDYQSKVYDIYITSELELKTHTLSFVTNGGNAMADATIYDNAYLLPDDPVREGYYFEGWYYDEGLTDQVVLYDCATEDTTIYAKWTKGATLTFADTGDSSIDAKLCYPGAEITKPTDPTKTKARFEGWYTSDTYETEFDFTKGITEDTTIYAKWTELVDVTYVMNGETIKTETIDKGTKYTAALPDTIKVYTEGMYTASDYATAYPTTEQTIDADTTIYIKEHDIDKAAAVRVAAYELDEKAFTWNETPNTYTGTDAAWTLTFAYDSFVVFDYASSGLTVTVNGASKLSVTEATEAKNFYMNIKANDVVVITATAETTISNLRIYNGTPEMGIMFAYKSGDSTGYFSDACYMNKTFADLKSGINELLTDEDFTGKGTLYKVAGLYHDAEFTKPVEDTDMWFKELTDPTVDSEYNYLYVYYSTNVTLTFVTGEGASTVDPINVWTREDLTSSMPEDPTKAKYGFIYWMDESGEEFDPSKGVEEAHTLTAYFDIIPEGGSKEKALVVGNKYTSGVTTTSKAFPKYYVKYVSTGNDYVYIDMPAATATITGGKASDNTLRNLTIEDKKGNVVVENITTFPYRLSTEAGQTYYFIFNMGNADNKSWGTFKFKVTSYDHDSLAESQGIPFDAEITISGVSLKDANETYLFTYVATENAKYRFNHAGSGWSKITIYSDAACTQVVTSHENAAGESTYFDFNVEEGKTYYVVVAQNWSNAEKAKYVVTFKVDNYPVN